MILDDVMIDTLMQWARQQAPTRFNTTRLRRRRVVLDIAGESNRVIARVYLALDGNLDCSLEQLTTPLAEMRIA